MMSLLRTTAILLAASPIASAYPAKRDASVCTEIRQRVPWSNLTIEEKDSYIQADLCLINSPSKGEIPGAVSRWDDLQWPHVVQTDSVHFVNQNSYWDETADILTFPETDMWSEAYFGGDGTGQGNCVETGPFANLTLRWVQDGSVSEHCLTRRFSQRSLQAASLDNIARCSVIGNYTDAWQCFSNGPHGSGHGGVGGIMSDATLSPGDPSFYLHHSWLDKLWWDWQALDLPARLTDIGGPNLPGSDAFPGGGGGGGFPGGNGSFPFPGGNGSFPGFPGSPGGGGGGGGGGGKLPGNGKGTGPEFTDYFGDNGNITTLNHRLYMAEIFPNITIADIMDIGGDVICSEYL
ncbi:hypothetical protein TruAng_004252 [Truncatella angustata]|nr:hypothetical protein TruAng_004252 [Truncatella angustata]